MKKRMLSLLLALCLGMGTGAAAISVPLPVDHWAYQSVQAMLNHEVMSVDEHGQFYPDQGTTRAEFVYALWMSLGHPTSDATESAFLDVSQSNPYLLAILWATENGITTGDGSGYFMPDWTVSREQAFTFLFRAIPHAPSFDYSSLHIDESAIAVFLDYGQINAWALEPMAALYSVGIVTGNGLYLYPGDDVANAETAALMYRAMDAFGTLNQALVVQPSPSVMELVGFWNLDNNPGAQYYARVNDDGSYRFYYREAGMEPVVLSEGYIVAQYDNLYSMYGNGDYPSYTFILQADGGISIEDLGTFYLDPLS